MCSFWWEKEKNLKFTAQEAFDAYDRIKLCLPLTSEFREATITEAGDNAMRWGAVAMALTALRVMEDSGLLQAIKDEFEEAKKDF